jgi:hypothetical protein
VPPSPDRDALELDIRIALGSPLVALEGYGSHGAHLSAFTEFPTG